MLPSSVSSEFARAVFDYLAVLGFDEAEVRAGAEIPSFPASNRLPVAYYEALFQAGEKLTGDHCFGFTMGVSPFPKSWGLVSHLAVSAPNALTAVSALMDYSELQLNFLRFRVRELEAERLCMEIEHDGQRALNRHVVEHLLGNIVILASTQIGYDLPAVTIGLAHKNEKSAACISERLGAKVELGTSAYRLEAPSEFLQQQSLYGEADLYRVTLELARDRLQELRGEDRLLNKVRETVLQQLPGGLPKIEDVAELVGMSGRTLQRRLRERQLRYQQILDEVRRELCQQMLKDAHLELHEVADYLGFNDQSAFQHAFRRWEGMTPGEYRRRARY
ncbi:MAG: helix-turn-helix domain-containing protein [Pseudomonadota bacterium]